MPHVHTAALLGLAHVLKYDDQGEHNKADAHGAEHGNGDDGFQHLGRLQFRLALALLFASQRGLHPISDPRWQRLWPLADSLGGDSDCVGGGRNGPTEQFNSLSFKHDGD